MTTEAQKHMDEQRQARAVRDQQKERKALLIRAIAEFICNDQALKSIHLERQQPWAKEWAKIRSASSVRGYPTVDGAIMDLERDLA